MKICPKCGQHLADTCNYCPICGAEVPASAAAPELPLGFTPAAPAAPEIKVDNFKAFVKELCPPTFNKFVKACYIALYVCAGLTLIVEIVLMKLLSNSEFLELMGISEDLVAYLNPGTMIFAAIIDVLIVALMAFWLQRTYSKKAAIVVLIYFGLNVILTLFTTGVPGGSLLLIFVIPTVSVLSKADRAYKYYLETGVVDFTR